MMRRCSDDMIYKMNSTSHEHTQQLVSMANWDFRSRHRRQVDHIWRIKFIQMVQIKVLVSLRHIMISVLHRSQLLMTMRILRNELTDDKQIKDNTYASWKTWRWSSDEWDNRVITDDTGCGRIGTSHSTPCRSRISPHCAQVFSSAWNRSKRHIYYYHEYGTQSRSK